jgi:mannose-6-phosphate isomerase-like protein (cupin superfamily)
MFTQVQLPPLAHLPSIRHSKTHEWVYIVEGSATAVLDKEKVTLRPNDYLYLPPHVWHSFRAGRRGVKALSLYMPGLNWEDPDIVKESGDVEDTRLSS